MDDKVITDHLEHLRLLGRAESTRYARMRALLRTRKLLGLPLLEATAADLLEWRRSLRLCPDTIAQYVSHVQEFYKWALYENIIGEDPSVRLPVPSLPRRLPRPIGDEDLAAAIAGAPARVRPWLILAAWLGLRAKEIALLSREQVLDTMTPPVLIVASGATKGRRERILPLSALVLRELRAAGLPASGWLFLRLDHAGGPNTPQMVSKVANDYLHSIGITATLHQLRHWFGTRVYQESGGDIRLVQELLGHARSSSTDVYAAYSRRNAAAAVESLPLPEALPLAGRAG